MKKYNILFLLGFCLSGFSLFANMAQRFGVLAVYPYSSKAKHMGAGGYSIGSNGELNVIKSLIKSGDLVFDVGANKGDWSKGVFACCPDVTVYAFEPIPHVCDALCSNVKRNNFFAYNIAFSNYTGAGTFYHCLGTKGSYDYHRLSSFYNRECFGKILKEGTQEITVNVCTIDDFCKQNNIEHIDFLKIDTEGAEFAVLQGAQSMIEQQKIIAIQFEYGGCYKDSHTTLRQVYQLLKDNDYSIFKIVPKGLVKIDTWVDELENFEYSNYLGLIEE